MSASPVIHTGLASSFADPADIAAFKRAKGKGMTDAQAFKFGDNGIGTPSLGEKIKGRLVGVDTTGAIPMCALPPDDWKLFGDAARGKMVSVTVGKKSVLCELRDTMPAKKNIKNGAVIDLNPAAAKVLGLKPPFMKNCSWNWV